MILWAVVDLTWMICRSIQATFPEILTVHSALFPNGKVLHPGGSHHPYDETLHAAETLHPVTIFG